MLRLALIVNLLNKHVAAMQPWMFPWRFLKTFGIWHVSETGPPIYSSLIFNAGIQEVRRAASFRRCPAWSWRNPSLLVDVNVSVFGGFEGEKRGNIMMLWKVAFQCRQKDVGILCQCLVYHVSPGVWHAQFLFIRQPTVFLVQKRLLWNSEMFLVWCDRTWEQRIQHCNRIGLVVPR